jgi:ferredoxin
MILVYFSPTHSTKKVAQAIASGTGWPTVEYELTLPAQRDAFETIPVAEGDCFLFASPVYGGHAFRPVLQMIRRLQGNKTPAVCVAVYGNRHYDMALCDLYDTVTEQGFLPVVCGTFVAEHSFTREIQPGRPNEQDLSAAREMGKKIGQLPDDGSAPVLTREEVPNRPVDLEAIGMHRQKLGSLSPNRPIASALCNQCGHCAKVCPLGLIDPSDSSVIQEKCIKCFACVKECPTGAMSFPQEGVRIVQEDCIAHFGYDHHEPEFWFSF